LFWDFITVHYNSSYVFLLLITSVADSDPNPDPSVPYVFGPPGSGSSGSFCHQVKIARKTLIPTVLRLLFYFLSLKNDVNVWYLPKLISRKLKKKKLVFVGVLKVNDENSRIQLSEAWIRGSGSTPKWHGSAKLDF
jgi:hypothetical protein